MPATRIYCSGPLFSPEEVGGMTAIARVLEQAGHATFLPHRDGLEAYVLHFGAVPLPPGLGLLRDGIDAAIFALDAYELVERCDAVVCNLNGRVPDEGMIVEAALAFAVGKPLVLYKDDARAPFGGVDNAMLTRLTGGRRVNSVAAIPGAVTEALARKTAPGSPSSTLQHDIAYGRRIARLLERLPAGTGKKDWDAAVIREVLALADERTA